MKKIKGPFWWPSNPSHPSQLLDQIEEKKIIHDLPTVIKSRIYTKWYNSQISFVIIQSWKQLGILYTGKVQKWAFLKSWKYIIDETVYCKSGFPWGVNLQKRQVYPTRFCCHIIQTSSVPYKVLLSHNPLTGKEEI